MDRNTLFVVGAMVLAVLASGYINKPEVVTVEPVVIQQEASSNLGAITGPDVYGYFTVHGDFTADTITNNGAVTNTGAVTNSSTVTTSGTSTLATTTITDLSVSGATDIDGAITASSTLGVTGAVQLYNTLDVIGALSGTSLSLSGQFSPTGITYTTSSVTGTTTTLTAADFGTVVYSNAASGTTMTLPAATDGGSLKFFVSTAFDTANVVIDSAEGDNIYGTLHVDGGLVPCSAEDQINFVNTAETVGDYVDLYSDGTSWFIGSSMGSTTGSMTCTDPS
jgi:hypothetical protein